jgi:hypothetical protein
MQKRMEVAASVTEKHKSAQTSNNETENETTKRKIKFYSKEII